MSERKQSVPDIKYCIFFSFMPGTSIMRSHPHGRLELQNPGFPISLTSTRLLWFISASLRGIIPHHQTTLTSKFDSKLCSPSKEELGSETSRPQEAAEAGLTFLTSGSSLICKYKVKRNNLKDTSLLPRSLPFDQVLKISWTTEEGVKTHCNILVQSLRYKSAGFWSR